MRAWLAVAGLVDVLGKAVVVVDPLETAVSRGSAAVDVGDWLVTAAAVKLGMCTAVKLRQQSQTLGYQ